LVIYALAPPSMLGFNGNFADDQLKGVYHFGIGKNKGILKSIQFNKSDFSFREARIEQEGLENATGLDLLANVYTVTIKMFGNMLFAPGSVVYIDPAGLGQIGSPVDYDSAARRLGIGGYHLVTKVQSFIESGKYETVIEARWESAGEDPTGDPSGAPGTAFHRRALQIATGARCPDGSRPRSIMESANSTTSQNGGGGQ